jgi:exonuclease III
MLKQDPSFRCIQETHFSNKDKQYFREKGGEKDLQANEPKKQHGVAILISNKMDFQLKVIKRDRYSSYLSKGKNHQDNFSVLNIYAPSAMAPTFIKATLLKYT